MTWPKALVQGFGAVFRVQLYVVGSDSHGPLYGGAFLA
jgi:hypothetical protein